MTEPQPRARQDPEPALHRRRVVAGYVGLTLAGLAILLRVIAAETWVGALLLLLGCAGMGWEARRVWLEDRARRARTAAQEARAALVGLRRARAQREREERRARRQAGENARTRQTAALRAAREQSLAAQRQEAAARSARQQHLERIAARWLTLNASELAAGIETLFLLRGFTPLHPDPAIPGELLLTAADGARSVARCLPPDHTAHAVEIQELDAWRREADAEHAYLVALAGFSPAAVRLARSLPLTLVEAHLLAAWEAREKPQSPQISQMTEMKAD